MSRLWKAASDTAESLIGLYSDSYDEPPVSLHSMMKEICYKYGYGTPTFPELADAKTISEMARTEISFDEVAEHSDIAVSQAVNFGIAMAKKHPDYYYNMEEFRTPSEHNGYHQDHHSKQSRYLLKRQYQLIQCRIWSDICRPDLQHLLGTG